MAARKGPEGTDQHALSAFPCLLQTIDLQTSLGYAMLGSVHHGSCVGKSLCRTSADA